MSEVNGRGPFCICNGVAFKKSSSGSGLAARDEAFKEVLGKTKDPKAATRTYVQGNKWLEENARAVGNV